MFLDLMLRGGVKHCRGCIGGGAVVVHVLGSYRRRRRRHRRLSVGEKVGRQRPVATNLLARPFLVRFLEWFVVGSNRFPVKVLNCIRRVQLQRQPSVFNLQSCPSTTAA